MQNSLTEDVVIGSGLEGFNLNTAWTDPRRIGPNSHILTVLFWKKSFESTFYSFRVSFHMVKLI